MSAACVGRTACVCHKQAAVGQDYFISKKKTRKKYFPKIDENAVMKIELLQLVYVCMYISTERI